MFDTIKIGIQSQQCLNIKVSFILIVGAFQLIKWVDFKCAFMSDVSKTISQ